MEKIKEIKTRIIKDLNNSTSIEELGFELGKWEGGIMKFYIGKKKCQIQTYFKFPSSEWWGIFLIICMLLVIICGASEEYWLREDDWITTLMQISLLIYLISGFVKIKGVSVDSSHK